MPSQTSFLGLSEYNGTTDGSALFKTFRLDIAGTSGSNNFSIIDNFANLISASSVSGSYIINENVVENISILDGAITGNKIASGTINGSLIGSNVITGSHILDKSISGSDIMDNVITGSHILDKSISGSDIMDNVITGSHIMDNVITGSHIMDGSITSDKLSSSSKYIYMKTNDDIITSGSGKLYFTMPFACMLDSGNGTVEGVSVSGSIGVNLYDVTHSVYLFSSPIVIDQGTYNTYNAGTPATITSASYANLVAGTRLRIDVQWPGSSATGLDVILGVVE